MNVQKNLAWLLVVMLVVSSCSKSTSTTSPGDTNTGDSASLAPAKIATSSEPDVNSATVETVWSTATPLTVSVSPMTNGVNFVGANRTFPVTIKSLVSDQRIFFLVEYADPTEDYLRTPLAFLGGNASDSLRWSRIPTYDDGVSFIIEQIPGSTDNGAQTFKANGCAMLCHANATGSWQRGMFSEDSGTYDLWYWHSGKSNADGFAEDNVLQGAPIYGLQKDDANYDNYRNNTLKFDSGYLPSRVAGGNNRQLDMLKYIADETATNFSGTKPNPATGNAWAAGDRVPAYTIGNPTPGNDYFDVAARGTYSNGKWTVKFSRALVTGPGKLDVSLVSGKSYKFSFAIHDATPPDNHYGVANKYFTLQIP